jgi:Txe/YoeB family toxin of Txe-Axe toxin-antitoxin module
MKTISINKQINFWRNARKEAIKRDAPINQIENNPSDTIAQLEKLVKQLREQKPKN